MIPGGVFDRPAVAVALLSLSSDLKNHGQSREEVSCRARKHAMKTVKLKCGQIHVVRSGRRRETKEWVSFVARACEALAGLSNQFLRSCLQLLVYRSNQGARLTEIGGIYRTRMCSSSCQT